MLKTYFEINEDMSYIAQFIYVPLKHFHIVDLITLSPQ